MERFEEIERSITTRFRSRIWSKFVKAIKDYQLLQPGDKVCCCISGGKDSMIMAKCFELLHRYSDFDFDVKYMVMNPGYNKKNLDMILNNLKILNIDATIVETNIFEVAAIQTKSPCYLCARMRRGALYRIAEDLGCNKIALGHHFDDVIETTLLNMFQVAKIETMLPKLHSDNFQGMQLIRPLYLIREQDIILWSNHNNLEFIACACKFTEEYKNAPDHIGGSKRAYIKNLIKELKKDNKDFEGNIFKSMENINLDKIIGYRKSGQKHSYLDKYDNLIRNDDAFSRSEKLLGNDKMTKLKNSKVLLFGVGGVGGHIAEALARSGVGRIDLVDDDVVSSSNINRQIVALNSTIGHHKVDIMRDRIIDINPKCEVKVFKLFYLPKNSNTFDFSQYDYIIDAVDTVTAKIEIIEKAKQAKVKVISAMGAGNKLDPTKFVVTDIYKTKTCPLAKVMRHELKKRGISDLKVVYSTEEAIKVETNEDEKIVPGSVSFVPSVCGLIVASEVVKDLTMENIQNE